jgi:membrane protein DedA with SNARE-associated domain
MGVMVLALLWGLFEATWFFIIPDVIISYIGLKSLKRALTASALAVGGALLGGTMMYIMSHYYFEETKAFLINIPAINEAMLTKVEHDLEKNGLLAIILGPTKGIPYKIYATYAASSGISYLSFLLVSIPARGIRFILASVTTYLLAGVAFKKYPYRIKVIGWLCVWLSIYSFYFWKFGF